LDHWIGAPGLRFAGCDDSGWAGVLVVPVDTGGPDAWMIVKGGPGWIRWIAVDDRAPLGPRLRALLRAAAQLAQDGGMNGLWLLGDSGGWLDPYLRDEGYRAVDEVITLEHLSARARSSRMTKTPWVTSPDAQRMRIRPAAQGDAEGVQSVDSRAFLDPWRYAPATVTRELATASVARIAQDGERVVGYASAVVREEGGHINRIAVDPAAQGRGLGKALLADMIDQLVLRGASRITLNTQRSNVVSQRLYRSSGFRGLGGPLKVYHRPFP
jgi:ribosomal protein S18 acetylase RimI-like enzyme